MQCNYNPQRKIAGRTHSGAPRNFIMPTAIKRQSSRRKSRLFSRGQKVLSPAETSASVAASAMPAKTAASAETSAGIGA